MHAPHRSTRLLGVPVLGRRADRHKAYPALPRAKHGHLLPDGSFVRRHAIESCPWFCTHQSSPCGIDHTSCVAKAQVSRLCGLRVSVSHVLAQGLPSPQCQESKGAVESVDLAWVLLAPTGDRLCTVPTSQRPPFRITFQCQWALGSEIADPDPTEFHTKSRLEDVCCAVVLLAFVMQRHQRRQSATCFATTPSVKE